MKKNVKRILAAILSVCLAIGCGACNNDKTPTDAPTEIVLSESDVTLKKGETLSLKVAGAEWLSPTFESDNPSVVTVNADGTMKAAGVGNAVVTVKSGKLSATCSVTVTQEIVYSLTLDKSAANLSVGSELSVTAHPKMAGEPLETVVEWTVEKVGDGAAESVATYVGNTSNTLTFTGKAEGKLTVTAKANGCEAKLTLTVTNATENVEDMASDQAYVLDEEQIAKLLADKTTNWASEKYMSCWSAVGHVAEGEYFSYSDGIQVHSDKYVERNDDETVFASATFSKDVIAAAIAKGYTHATVVVENVSVPWIALFNGESTAQVVAQKYPDNATSLTFKVALASFTDGLRVKAVGIWGGHTIKVTSLTLFNAVQEAIETGFASEGTNWASEDYVAVWGSVSGTTPAYDSTNSGVKYNYFDCGDFNNNVIGYVTFNSNVLKAAEEKGYTKLSVTAKGIGYKTVWLNAGGPDGMETDNALARIMGAETGTIELNLADLLNATTGEYCLGMTFGGWWGGCAIVFTSLTFSK